MKTELKNIERDLEITFNILKNYRGRESNVNEILFELFKNNAYSSDFFYMILSELKKRNLINSQKDIVEIKDYDEKVESEIKEFIVKNTKNKKRLILTPLDVAKFYLCQRRLWLEKIVLSREEKEEKGKNWDGEALHLASKLAIQTKNVKESVEKSLKEFENKLQTLNKESLENFLEKILEFFSGEEFKVVVPEREIISLKFNMDSIIDIVAIRKGEVLTFDIKYGKVNKELREEHIIQSVGEAISANSFFRSRPKESYIIYYESDKIVKIDIGKREIGNFLRLLKSIKKTYSSPLIPPMSNLPNFRKRVCAGCHVRKACDLIEFVRRFS